MKVFKNFYINGLIGLLVLFLVMYFLFGQVFASFTPSIAQRVEAVKQAALEAVTGGRDAHELTDITLVDGVSTVMEMEGGYLVTATAQGAEAPITLTVAVDGDGAVSGIMVVAAEEAPDYGGRALQEAYLSTFTGATETENVDAFAGATFTSVAIKECVDKALTQVAVLGGADYEAPLTPEEQLAVYLTEFLGEGYEKAAPAELADTAQEVYTSANGCSVVTEANGAGGPIRLLVNMDAEGVVRLVKALSHTEPLGRGDQYLTDAALFFYQGYSAFGYFDDGSGIYVFDKFDDTNLALATMLIGAAKQFALMNG